MWLPLMLAGLVLMEGTSSGRCFFLSGVPQEGPFSSKPL